MHGKEFCHWLPIDIYDYELTITNSLLSLYEFDTC